MIMKRLMMKANEKVVIRIVDDDPAIHDSLGLIFGSSRKSVERGLDF